MFEILLDILVIMGIVAVVTDQLSKNKKLPTARPKGSQQAPPELSKNKKLPTAHPEPTQQPRPEDTQQPPPEPTQLSLQKKQKREQSQSLSIEPLAADVEMLHPKK